jgi:23S rRNA (pseudouridine1915-N3)-methyltransferase
MTGPAGELLKLYLERAGRYLPAEIRAFASEAKLLEFVEEATGRTRPVLVLADGRGQQVTSPQLSDLLGKLQDDGVQTIVFAIGPANGWSPATLKRADKTVAFGKITLPHELAAVVAAEQIYRALTIRAGHPYHSGHE